jgi:hypothetical protein
LGGVSIRLSSGKAVVEPSLVFSITNAGLMPIKQKNNSIPILVRNGRRGVNDFVFIASRFF